MYRFGSCFVAAITLLSCLDLGSSNVMEEILKMGEEAYNADKAKPVDIPENETFDFIIIGAGSGGSVLANRLSENPDWNILLIESGGRETIVNEIPVLASYLQLTEANWKYQSTPQKHGCLGMNNNKCALPSGRGLGGMSSINFMVYSRGNPKDFDDIAKAGNNGWSYQDVLPYFLRSERASLGDLSNSLYHNTTGLQSVEHVKYRTDVAEASIQSFKELGYFETDYNAAYQHGTAFVQGMTENGKRHSASKAFLEPIMHERKNLRILTFCSVNKILIDQKSTAYGIELNHKNKIYTIKASKEVILSAGTFNSAQLLMLSGIGPKDALSKAGVKQLVNLPVGKTLYDHVAHIGPTFTTNSTGSTLFLDRITKDDVQRFMNGDPSTRLSTLSGLETLTFVDLPSKAVDGRPDIELLFVTTGLAFDNGYAFQVSSNFRDEIYTNGFKSLEGTEHFTLGPMLYYPKSTGRIWLNGSDPANPPLIDPNYYSEQEDVEVMLAGIKEALRIAETPAMKKVNATLYTVKVPGCTKFDFGTDDYWRCSIRVLTYSENHQVGTCRMGPSKDRLAVVSPELKVHGINKLRVVDSSVLPAPTSGHTTAISLMIGEKAADMIKSEWQNTRNCHRIISSTSVKND